MGLEVGGLSSIELSGLEMFVAGETQVWEGDGFKKVVIVISLESSQRIKVITDVRVLTKAVLTEGGVAAVSTGNLGSEESTADHIQYLSHNGSHDCNNGRLGPGGVGHRAGSGESRSGLLSVLGVYVGFLVDPILG
ncbi:Forkhead Box Protein M1 [Manis pentadactyla]|nr:Forkhead Box Protein M1 [Manis pentadactyla]